MAGWERRQGPHGAPPAQTPMRQALSFGAVGALLAVAGLLVLAYGSTVVGVVILAVGLLDLAVAAFYALRTPYVPRERDPE